MTKQMIEVKTAELEGVALDWAAAKAAGWVAAMIVVVHGVSATRYEIRSPSGLLLSPSTDWSQGGPLMESNRVGLEYCGGVNGETDEDGDLWCGYNDDHPEKIKRWGGKSPLVAAMRLIVYQKLGYTVSIPRELLP